MKQPDDNAGGAGVESGEPDMAGIFGEIFDAPEPGVSGDDAGDGEQDDDAAEEPRPAAGKKPKPDESAESEESLDPEADELAPDAEEPGEDDDDEEDEDEDKPDEKEKLKLPEKFRARLDKVVKQREAARTERDALKAEAATLREQVARAEAEPVMLQPTAANPLANVRNAAELDAAASYWTNLLEWAEENDAGGLLKQPDGTEQELDRTAVKRLRRTARDMIEKAVPERRAFLEKRPAAVAKAKTAYPFLQDASHKGAKYAAQLVAQAGLASLPDYEVIAGDAYIGALVRTGAANVVKDSKTGQVKIVPRSTAPTTPASKKPPAEAPPVTTRAGAQPLRPAGRDGQREEIMTHGTAEERAAMAFTDIL